MTPLSHLSVILQHMHYSASLREITFRFAFSSHVLKMNVNILCLQWFCQAKWFHRSRKPLQSALEDFKSQPRHLCKVDVKSCATSAPHLRFYIITDTIRNMSVNDILLKKHFLNLWFITMETMSLDLIFYFRNHLIQWMGNTVENAVCCKFMCHTIETCKFYITAYSCKENTNFLVKKYVKLYI